MSQIWRISALAATLHLLAYLLVVHCPMSQCPRWTRITGLQPLPAVSLHPEQVAGLVAASKGNREVSVH